jgi:hypothetical protein
MEKLDDYIKTILDQSQPTYSDAYWKQTAMYIEEKRKKRFFWFLWFSSGMLALIIGVGALFLFTSNSKPDHKKSDQTINQMALVPGVLEVADPYSIESKSNLNLKQQQKADLPTFSKSRSISNFKSLDNLYTNSITSSLFDSESPQDGFSHSESMMLENLSVVNGNNHSKIERSTTTQNNVLTVLDLPLRIESLDKPTLKISQLQESKVIVADPVHSKLSYYFDLGGIMNPVFSPDQKWSLGMSGGFGINFDFKQKFILQAGISYLHRWGTFNVMIDHPTPIYNFAKDDRGYSLVPTDAGYLTFPLSIGIPFGKYSFGVGINSMRLLGAKGNVFAYEGLPAENEPDKVVYRSTQISSGWIETPGFRKWVFEYNLFMERKMNTHLNVGLRFGYLPKGLVKSDYNFYFDNESMKYIERETAGLLENNYHLTIYMTYRL